MARFQSFWTGNSLTPYEAVCLRSFVDCGHEFYLFSYNRNLSVPSGVTVRDAGEILPESSYFEAESPHGDTSPSAFSDLFRWTLLYKLGGWWVDTDVVCLSSDVPEFDLFFAEEVPGLLGSAVLFAPSGHPVLKHCVEVAASAKPPIPWGSIGPALITQTIRSFGLYDRVQPASRCYPIHWAEALDVLLPEQDSCVRERVGSALFLHLWNQIFLRNAVDKFCMPPKGSFLRSIADRHPVEGWRSELNEEVVRARSDLSKSKWLSGNAVKAAKAQLETAKAELKAATAELATAQAALKATKGKLATESAALETARTRLAALYASPSWRVTRPLRFLARAFRPDVLRDSAHAAADRGDG